MEKSKDDDILAAMGISTNSTSESDRILQAIMDYVPEGITIAEPPDVNIRMVSNHGLQLTGQSEKHLIGISMEDHAAHWRVYKSDGVTPAKSEELPLTRATLHGAVIRNEEWVVERPDGEKIPVLCNAGPIRDREGNITGGIIAWRDITALKQAQEGLQLYQRDLELLVEKRTKKLVKTIEKLKTEIVLRRDAEKRLVQQGEIIQKIFDNIPVMLCFYDQRGGFKLINKAFEKHLGWGIDELAKMEDPMAEFYPDKEYRRQVWQYMMEAYSGWRDFKVRTRTGNELESSWANVRLKDGSQVGIGIDITERKAMERVLKNLSGKLLKAQEDERRMVAQDLHDSIGSNLAAVKFGLESCASKIKSDDGEVKADIKELVSLVQASIDDLRRIMGDLRPSMLDDLGLLPTLRWQCDRFKKLHPDLDIECQLDVDEDDIPQGRKTVIFRIVQEALNNVMKHSKGEQAFIDLRKTSNGISLIVKDNGKGFDTSGQVAEGIGLSSMRERAALSGGTFSIQSAPGKGTSVEVVWATNREGSE
jgi:PAS domain S-box-containing protein